jgi:hypothetical protein
MEGILTQQASLRREASTRQLKTTSKIVTGVHRSECTAQPATARDNDHSDLVLLLVSNQRCSVVHTLGHAVICGAACCRLK